MQKIKILLRGLMGLYPNDICVRPSMFEAVSGSTKFGSNLDGYLVAFEAVQDKFYFLLWGAIKKHMDFVLPCRGELVVVQGLNGAVGRGWISALKRSWPIAWIRNRPWVRAFGSLMQGVGYRCSGLANPWVDFRALLVANKLWHQMIKKNGKGPLRFETVELADLIIDTYLRYRPSPKFDVLDPFVRTVIWRAVREIWRAKAYFGQVKPRIYCTSYSTYIEHGIPVRVALKMGVEVWSFGSLNRFGKKLTIQDSYHTQDFTGYRSGFEVLDRQEERLEEARDQLEKRLSGGIDAATSYMRQSAYAQPGIPLPARLDGAAVVFLHDFYDSPHVYPDLVFDDFWQWICFTIETLQNAEINFFIKPHPNQIALSDEALGSLRKKYQGLNWLPSGASNVQLALAGIACGVTVYGTVAHELAYLGVPSIACARHPHFTFDFCRTARTREEYRDMLESCRTMPLLSREEMQRQALAFYYMHNLTGDSDERQLQRAFVAFWRACNIGTISEDGVIHSFQELLKLPAFDRFVQALAASK